MKATYFSITFHAKEDDGTEHETRKALYRDNLTEENLNETVEKIKSQLLDIIKNSDKAQE